MIDVLQDQQQQPQTIQILQQNDKTKIIIPQRTRNLEFCLLQQLIAQAAAFQQQSSEVPI